MLCEDHIYTTHTRVWDFYVKNTSKNIYEPPLGELDVVDVVAIGCLDGTCKTTTNTNP